MSSMKRAGGLGSNKPRCLAQSSGRHPCPLRLKSDATTPAPAAAARNTRNAAVGRLPPLERHRSTPRAQAMKRHKCYGPPLPLAMASLAAALLSTVLLSAAAYSQIPTNSLPLRIGADQLGGNALDGELGVVRLFDRALTESEIQGLARLRPDSKTALPGLAGEWLRNGNLSDMTPWGRLGVTNVGGINAVSFSGGNLTIGNEPAFDLPGGLTIEAWIRPRPG